jgi:hypothetical protein
MSHKKRQAKWFSAQCAVDHARPTLLAVASAVVVLLAVAPFSQAKVVVNGFGADGTFGGQFEEPRGIAINQTGSGGVAPGTVYVADTREERIQRFGPSGTFERAWGENVKGRDEKQLITISNINGISGGSFTLSFEGETTAPIVFDPHGQGDNMSVGREDVENALTALPSIEVGDIAVEGFAETRGSSDGGTFSIRFRGGLSGIDVPQITADGSELRGGGIISGSTVEQGLGGNFTGFEVCTAAAECQDAPRGDAKAAGNGGQVLDPSGLGINQITGDVYVSETGNARISEFDADGNFIRAWGWDVVESGKPNDKGTNAFEICDTTLGDTVADCRRGKSNPASSIEADGGRFGGFFLRTGSPHVDSLGNVWIPDTFNRRFQEFDENGNFIAVYGYNVDALGGGGGLEKCTSTAPGACQAGEAGTEPGQFSGEFFGNGPANEIAVDSSGNLYALNTGEKGGGVKVFNPALTSASVFAAAALAPYTVNGPEHVLATHAGSRLVFVVNNNVSANELQLVELDIGSEEVKDTSLVGAHIETVNSLDESTATGNLYLTTMSEASPYGVLILGDSPPPSDPVASMESVTTKTDTTATFGAGVDPKGGLVTCKFQYSLDQSEWTDVPAPGCAGLAINGGPQAVSADATGLDPHTHYYVRMAVSRTFIGGSTEFSAPVQFDTDAVPPVVSNVGAVDIGNNSLRLAGRIDPRGSQTEYVFKYGLTPAVDSSTAPIDIGSGQVPVIISQGIQNLSTDTTYYYQLVATSLSGSTASSVQTVKTRATETPEVDHRRYELVTPPDKNFGDADYSSARIAWNGEGATSCMTTGFGDPPGQFRDFCIDYISLRGPDGWRTTWANTPYCLFDIENAVGTSSPVSLVGSSRDFDRGLINEWEMKGCAHPAHDPTAPLNTTNTYLVDYAAPGAGPSDFTRIPNAGFGVFSADGNTVATFGYSGGHSIIQRVHEGTVTLASRDPSGAPFSADSFLAETDPEKNPVSDDGRRIFFYNPSFGSDQEIYMRQDETTFDVSESECTAECGVSERAKFLFASPDGSRVFFESGEKLTDDPTPEGENLYMFEQGDDPAGEPHNLTLVSADDEPLDGDEGGLGKVIGLSEDAGTVFFVSSSQLVGGAPTETGAKVYRWRWNEGSPSLDYLATLAPNEFGEFSATETNRPVTPNGDYLLINTVKPLDPVVDYDSTADVYRWSAQQGWQCISCQAPGAPSAGNAAVSFRWTMSEDGQRIFFTTADALVPDDIDGSVRDVYEWHDGRITLISSGQATTDFELTGIGRSGRDVFFWTRERLVGWDFDESVDLYDARIDGGFPEPPAQPPLCEGEACRGAASTLLPAVTAGTAVFEGPGDSRGTVQHKCGRGYVKRHGECVKKRHKKRHQGRRGAR